jgi:hypothetical protein
LTEKLRGAYSLAKGKIQDRASQICSSGTTPEQSSRRDPW